jgi:putative FmdB family regulatory protein
MPFYEYECSHCKFYVEALQKISDPPLVKCPSCAKQTLKRLLSAPNFRLKGAGWYETDFKSDKEAKRNIAGAEDKPVSDSKDGEESKSVRSSRRPTASKAHKKAKPATAKQSARKKPGKKPAIKHAIKNASKGKVKTVKKKAAKKK